MTLKPSWFHILLSLAEGDAHGAAIRRSIYDRTEGTIELYPAMLYGSLDDLSERGWINEIGGNVVSDEDPTNRRRVYQITETGRDTLATEARRLETLIRRVDSALEQH